MIKAIQSVILSGLCILAAFAETPKAGEPAPPFSLPDANGKLVALKEYAGKEKVVLVFYRGNW